MALKLSRSINSYALKDVRKYNFGQCKLEEYFDYFLNMKQMVFSPYPLPPNDESQAGKEKKRKEIECVSSSLQFMTLHFRANYIPSATYLLHAPSHKDCFLHCP